MVISGPFKKSTLLSSPLIFPIFRELFRKGGTTEDETIYDFIKRRLNQEVLMSINYKLYRNQSIFITKNLPMQYTEIFSPVKIEKINRKCMIFFLIFAQNINCGYMLELPRRGGSNEYPQSMFWSKNMKNRYTPGYPSLSGV